MTGTAFAPAAPVPPPIPDDLDAVLRRMRFPYLRKAAPEVLATARAQRWDPAEVIRILLEEEIRGRDEAGRQIRRKAAGLPAGKTFGSWREHDSACDEDGCRILNGRAGWLSHGRSNRRSALLSVVARAEPPVLLSTPVRLGGAGAIRAAPPGQHLGAKAPR
jgi:hypothetical protein